MVDYKGYYDMYTMCRSSIKDEEILPSLDFDDFKRFVSQRDWTPIPLRDDIVNKKKDITESPKPHLCISLREKGMVSFDVFFNGTQAVKNFTSILEKESMGEKREFIEALKSLDDRFYYDLLYCEKFFSAAPKWETELEDKCRNLTDDKVEQLLKKIKEVLQKREFRQSVIDKSHVATVAMSIAWISIDRSNHEEIKEGLQKVINVFRICRKIKTYSEIKKIRKETETAEKAKQRALEEAKECQIFRKIDECSPDGEDKCKKCPHDWHEFL